MPGKNFLDRMHPKLERRRDAEIRARTSHRPEQVVILAIACGHYASVRSDHLDTADTVASISELRRQRALASAERISRHPDRHARAERHRHLEHLRETVELCRRSTASNRDSLMYWIDRREFHQ